MKASHVAAAFALMLQATPCLAQISPPYDPTSDLSRPFGLGGHACKQYDDTGKLFIYSEGVPSVEIVAWLQRSDNGTKANIPMPQDLVVALPLMPGCLPGKHHAASANG